MEEIFSSVCSWQYLLPLLLLYQLIKKKIQEIKESQSEIDWNKIKNSLIITMMLSTVIIFLLFSYKIVNSVKTSHYSSTTKGNTETIDNFGVSSFSNHNYLGDE